jgi:hypothetical protein
VHKGRLGFSGIVTIISGLLTLTFELVCRYSEVVVFVIGGGCYAEYGNLQVRRCHPHCIFRFVSNIVVVTGTVEAKVGIVRKPLTFNNLWHVRNCSRGDIFGPVENANQNFQQWCRSWL